MEPTERKSKALTLVASGNDEKGLTERRYCKALLNSFQCFTSGAERVLKPGMLAQWKNGMKNRRTPDYGEPMVVVELLHEPILDTDHKEGSVYFREPLDLLLGFLDEDSEFCVLHYDSRRFEPCTGEGMDTAGENA